MREQILFADDAVAFARRVQAILSRRNITAFIAQTFADVFDHIASSGPFSLFVLGQTVGGMPAQSVLDVLRNSSRMGTASVLLSDYSVKLEANGTWTEIEKARQLADKIGEVLGHTPAAVLYPVRCGPLIINPENHEVRIEGKLLSLSPREIEVLHYFVEHVGELVTREDLLQFVWRGDKTVKIQTVDVYLKRLRALCNAETKELSFRTVTKMGYQLVVRKSASDITAKH